MNLTGLIGKKLDQTQAFLEDGTRVPLTTVKVSSNVVTQIKTMEREGYHAIKLGFDTQSRAKKPISGIAKKAGLKETPRFFREIRLEEAADAAIASVVVPEEVFEPGDMINVTGISKGKGYAGVVKRHGFRGGPRTHGQSDRERAPGSIGQTTTPGRVYKGKRMAGRMGNEQVTIKNLTVMDIVDGVMFVKGLVPGPRGSVVVLKKIGVNKKFVPLFKQTAEVSEESVADAPVLEEKAVDAEVQIEPVVEETVVEEPITEEKGEKSS